MGVAFERTKQKLKAMIVEMSNERQLQLPSELDLMKKFDVSRSTLRSAVEALQKEGLLSRVHGKGTFINFGVVGTKGNLNEGRPFLSILTEEGYTAFTYARDGGELNVETEFQDMYNTFVGLKLSDNMRVIERIFLGDKKPVILAVDFINSFYQRELPGTSNGEFGVSIYEFAHLNLTEAIAYSTAELIPVLPSSYISKLLQLTENLPILLLKHKHYFQFKEQPIAITCAFVNSTEVSLSVVRSGYEL